MSDPIQFCVPEHLNGQRADKVLAAQVTDISRTRLQTAFERGEVWVEGEVIDKKHKIFTGDLVEIILPEITKVEVNPVEMPIEVIFEDDDVIAINKTSGVITHPGSGTGNDTLVHGMLFVTGGKLSAMGGAVRPGVVHRLDKETSGVMIFAKTDAAYLALVKMFSERTLDKQYLTLVQGVPGLAGGTIKTGIRRDPIHRTLMQVHESGRDAHTEWAVEKRFQNSALIRCWLHTGRTHQLRVHLSGIGFPIMGDDSYGYRYRQYEPSETRSRVYLHAHKLSLQHPTKPHQTLHLQAPLPKDFAALIEKLK